MSVSRRVVACGRAARGGRGIARHLLLSLVVSAMATGALAQTAVPQVTVSGLDQNPLIGTPLVFTVSFDNASPTQAGYGPYIDLILPATGADGAGAAADDGITFVSASYLGQPVVATAITFNASGQATHPYAVTSLGAPLVVTGTPGDQLVVLQLPFGSFTPDQPPAPVVVTTALSNLADAGFPLSPQVRGGFQFGNTPLNDPATDPSVFGTFAAAGPVTPTVLRLTKTYIGPEDETATGPNFPRQYRIAVDVANGQTVADLDITDALPANLQFLAVTNASAVGSPAVTDVATPSTTTPGGTLTRRFASVTGTAGAEDAILEFSFFVPRVDAGSAVVIPPDTGDDATSPNQAGTQGSWDPIDNRDGIAPVSAAGTGAPPEHTLTPKSIAVQKGVTIAIDTGAAGASPGDTLEYTIDVQVSDYFALQDLVLTDVLSDGQRHDGVAPRLSVVEHSGGDSALAPMDAGTWDFVVSGTTGDTTATFRVSQALIARALDGRLVGGCVPQTGTGGAPPDCTFNGGATTFRVTYRTVIQDTFDFPSPGDASVDHGDVLDNAVTVDAAVLSVTDAQTPTGFDEQDTSAAGVTILVGTLTKSIYAINDDISFTTPRLGPGDTVTYRLQYTLPSSDMEPLTITDFLPLPVLAATEVTVFEDVRSAVPPSAGRARFGPADTFRDFSGIVPAIATDAVANSVRFTWTAVDDPLNQPRVIDILFTVTASDQPFADGLFLTNQARSREGSTNAGETVVDAIVQIQLNEPNLRIQKGAVTSSNPADVYAPATVGPVAFTAPGSAGTRWAGTISSTGLAATPINSNVSALDAGDIVTFAIVVENLGSGPDGAFDVTVRDTLPAGFVAPADLAALNLRVTDGAGAPLAFSDLGSGPFGGGGGLFGNGLQLEDPGGVQGALRVYSPTAGTNVAVVTYDLVLASTVGANQALTNTATLTNYAGTEGGPDFTTVDLTDPATASTAAPSLTKQFTNTDRDHTMGNAVAVGEVATYTLTVRVPEGTTPSATIVDTLDPGLAFVDVVSIAPSSPALTASAGTFDAVRAAAVIGNPSSGAVNDARRLTLTFGTLTNTDTDNATPETLAIVYRAVVINSSGTNRGTLLNNAASLTFTGGTASASAPNVTVVEPVLLVTKSASPVSGDADDLITFTITLSNPAATNAADAFDVSFADPLPTGLTFVSAVPAGGVPPTTGPTVSGNGFTATFDRLNVGQSSVFTVVGRVAQGLTTGTVLTNTASAAWTSLPGDPGQITTNNSLAYERTGNAGGPGGSSNDHVTQGSATVTVSTAGVAKIVVTTDQAHTADPAVAVGEIITYSVTVTVPEATSTSVTLEDTLDPGLAFVSFDSLVVSNPTAVTTSVPGGFAAVLAGAAVSNPGGTAATAGSRVTFTFGDITNTDVNSAVAETITVTYRAVVLNTAANVRGQARNNSARWRASGADVTASAPDVTLVEPTLAIDKQIAPASADAGDTVTVTLVLSHAAASNADAFGVALRDALPAGLVFAGNLQHTAGTPPTALSQSGGVVNATWASFPLGATSTVTFTATVAATTTPGQVVTNTATTTHTSLPGDPGERSTLNAFAYERTGNPADPGGAANTYAASDPATVTLYTNAISGFAYVDRNDDGIFQSGGGTPELPIAGVTILLTGTDNLGNAVSLTRTTLADGSYVFDTLRPGTYTLTQVQPAGYVDGRDTVGTIFGGTAGNDVIAAIAIPAGGNASGASYNFGERETADLSVVKADSADPVVPGASLTYTLTVTNAGPSVAANVRVTDPLPSGTGFVSLSAAGWTCAAPAPGSRGDVACSIPSMAVGEVRAITVEVTVEPTLVSGAVLTNAVAVGADTVDPVPDNNRDRHTTHVGATGTADLSITKTDLADPVLVGQTITYTVVVRNDGPSGATGVVLTDVLPATLVLVSATPTQGACTGTTTLACDLGPIGSGGTASVTIVATATVPGVVTNTVSVTGDEPDANPDNNTASEPTTVANPSDADLSVRKVDAPDPAAPGQVVTYTVTVGNAGPAAAANVVVTDTLPAGTTFESVVPPAGWTCPAPVAGVLTCTVPTLPSGDTVSIVVAVRVDAGATSGTTLTNAVSVASTTPDPDPANNQATEPTSVVAPTDADVLIVKTDAPDVAVAGTEVSYTLSVTNRGRATATNVTVTDTLPPGTSFVGGSSGCTAAGGVVTCVVGTIAPGSSLALGLTISTPPTPGAIANTATVVAAEPDPFPANNVDPEPTTLVARADVAILKTGPASATAGTTLAYTLAIVNNGPSVAADVTVTDPTPPGLTFVSTSGDCTTAFPCALGTLAPGATRTIVVAYQVPSAYTAPDPIANTATVATSTIDTDPTNNSSPVTTPLVIDGDLRLGKIGPATVVAGQTITYTIAVINDGPSDATGVSVADPTPAGLVFQATSGDCTTAFPCALGTLVPGATRTITATYQVPPDYAAPDPIVNTATVSATSAESDLANNRADATTTLGPPQADLLVTKSGPATVVPGNTVTYTIAVTNLGPSTTTAVSLSDPTPVGLTFVSTAGACTTPFPCALGTMAPGETRVVLATFLVPAAYQLPDPIVNVATVTSAAVDPTPANNTATAETGVGADLVLTKSAAPSPAVAGSEIAFTLASTNLGGRVADNLAITDAVPAGTTFVSAEMSDGQTCGTRPAVGATGTIRCVWPGQTLAGTTRTLVIRVRVNAGLASGATIANTAVTSSDVNDPNPANNTATTSTPVVQSADIAVAKSVDQPTPNFGDLVTFVVTVSNLGPSDATGVGIVDALPAGLALVGATPAQGAFDPASGLWTVGALPAGGSTRLTLTARVLRLGTLVNTATRTSGDQPDPDAGNNTAASPLSPNPVADVRVRKSVDRLLPSLGDTVTFTVVVDNAGPNDATGVVVSDALPAGLDLVSATTSRGTYDASSGTWAIGAVGVVAPPEGTTLTIVARVTQTGPIVNTARKSFQNEFDPVDPNNTSAATVNGQAADLQVVKTVDDTAPRQGQIVTFTIVVTNNGPNATDEVVVQDALPPGLAFASATASQGTYAAATGLWRVGRLAETGAAATATLTVSATVTSAGVLRNTASVVGSSVPDTNPSNDRANASVEIDTSPVDLTLVVNRIGDACQAGALVDFFISVTSLEEATVSGPIVVSLELPDGLTYASGADGWRCRATGRSVVCQTSDVVLNKHVSTTLRITATAGAIGAAQWAYASVMHAEDSRPENNVDYMPVCGEPVVRVPIDPVDLATAIAPIGGRLAVGDVIAVRATVTNGGPDPSPTTSLVGFVPDFAELLSAVPDRGTCVTLPAPSCELGPLAVRASTGVTWRLRLAREGVFRFNLAALGTEFDPSLTNNADAVTLVVEPGDATGRDSDGDGMPDEYESTVGLNPAANDAAQDADGDGASNLAEYQAGTHPRGRLTRYFAEGASGAFFATRFALLNPSSATAASVVLRLQFEDGTSRWTARSIPRLGRITIDARELVGDDTRSFAAAVEADALVVADRTMRWDARGYGSHAESAVVAPATRWHFAEGATHGGLQLFYLLQNPDARAAEVEVRYLRPTPAAPIVQRYTLAPRSRQTVWVNLIAGLESVDVSGDVRSINGVPIVVERAMYLDRPGEPFSAGHAAAGVTDLSAIWTLAEGATGDFFDEYVLIANPDDRSADVTVTYAIEGGATVSRQHVVAPRSRYTIPVDLEDPRLANAAVSARVQVTNGVPVAVERAMWWPGPTPATWHEAHVSAGARGPALRWAVAEGEAGGPDRAATYLLVANAASTAGSVRVTVTTEQGLVRSKTFALPADARLTVEVAREFPEAAGARFGAIVESVGPAFTPIVVEWAMYGSPDDRIWAAGSGALATPLP